MVDLKCPAMPLCTAKNPKWEDFHVIDMPKHKQKPLTAESIERCMKIQRVHQMLRAIRRAKDGEQTPTKPKGKLVSFEDMPKELYDKFFGNVHQ